MGWIRRLFGFDSGGAEPEHLDSLSSEFDIYSRIEGTGLVDGAHYTEYVERVKQLKREARYSEAIELLLKLVDATEAEAKAAGGGWGVAPGYYEHLAIVYRKMGRFADEVAILERCEDQPKAPGVGPYFAQRLTKAKELAAKSP